MPRSSPPERRPDCVRERGVALGVLVEETVALFRELRGVAAELHGEGRLSGGHRGVVAELDRRGPRTVPQMARARSVTRQHLQTHVNELVSLGAVELIENPEHKKSRLVRITEEGQRKLEEMNRREQRVLAGLGLGAGADEIEAAVEVLKELRVALRAWCR
jgi:DNA-binding MarR family transcriptional regulator